MGKWSIPIDKLVAKAGTDMDTVVRKITIDLFGRVIQRSPVDTGRLRGNWQASLDAPIETPIDTLDPDGMVATDKAIDAVMAFPVGQVTYLANALPYAYRIEYEGWSKQAPAGMVRLAARELSDAVQKAVA